MEKSEVLLPGRGGDDKYSVTKVLVEGGQRVYRCDVLLQLRSLKGTALSLVFDAHEDALVTNVCVREGDVIASGHCVLKYTSCAHDMVFKGLCAVCGCNLTEEYEKKKLRKQTVKVLHAQSSLEVSHRIARKSAREDCEQLLSERKLILVLDIDHTLLHASADPRAELARQCVPPVPDVASFELGTPLPTTYFIKLRPHIYDFLQEVRKMFKLHIYTQGTRPYALQVCKVIDPKGILFGERVLSADDVERDAKKFKRLTRIFPVDDSMVVVIDDRVDVWKRCKNIIRIHSFDFWKDLPHMTRVSWDIDNPNQSAVAHGKGSSEKALKSEKRPKKACSTAQSKQSLKRTRGVDGAHESPESEPVDVDDNGEGVDDGDADEDDADADEEANVTLVDDRSSKKRKTVKVLAGNKKEGEEDDVDEGDDTDDKNNDMDVSEVEHTDDEEAEEDVGVDDDNNDDDDDTVHQQSKAVEEEEEGKDDVTSDVTLSLSQDTHAVYERKALEDHSLLDMLNVLRQLHTRFFQQLDAKPDKGPDVKLILRDVRSSILEGVHILFTGILPHSTDESHPFIQLAIEFGAVYHSSVGPEVTHVVGIRSDTAKATWARKHASVHAVSLVWFAECIIHWRRFPESDFLLSDFDGFDSEHERFVTNIGKAKEPKKSENLRPARSLLGFFEHLVRSYVKPDEEVTSIGLSEANEGTQGGRASAQPRSTGAQLVEVTYEGDDDDHEFNTRAEANGDDHAHMFAVDARVDDDEEEDDYDDLISMLDDIPEAHDDESDE